MIQKTYDDGKKHIHVLSFGAGTQSTALLLMALKGEINGVIPDYIIFSDTGWEPKRVYEWVEKVSRYVIDKYGATIHITDNGNIRSDIIDAVRTGKRYASLPLFTKADDGKGGMIMRQCTKEYKIDPVSKKIRDLLGYKPRQRVKEVVHVWKGISTDEIQRVKPSLVRWQVMEHPLVDIVNVDRSECIAYVERERLGTPPKSSCLGCPFHDNKAWLEIKRNDPEGWREVVEFDRVIRNMPKLRGQAFLHRSRVPIDEVDFGETPADIDGFDNECEGMCGV